MVASWGAIHVVMAVADTELWWIAPAAPYAATVVFRLYYIWIVQGIAYRNYRRKPKYLPDRAVSQRTGDRAKTNTLKERKHLHQNAVVAYET
eukprot:gene650-11348_t